MKRLGMLRQLSFVACAAVMAMGMTACGDDDDGGPPDARQNPDAPLSPDAGTFDARNFDARTFDARTFDANPNDAGPTFSGTMAVHDIQLFGIPTAGHGVQTSIDFTQRGVPVTATYTVPESFPSCSGTVVDTTVAAQNNPGVDEGTVTIMRNGAAIAAPCTFNPDGTYRCVSAQGASGTIAQSATNPNVGTFTNGTVTFSQAQVGQYLVVVSGAERGKAWPIVGFDGMTAGLQKMGAAFPTAVDNFLVAYGIGPIAFTDTPAGTASPGAPPDLLADSDKIIVQLTPGGGNHFQPYTSTEIDVGNSFALDDATEDVFTDGLDIYSETDTVLGCNATGCPTGSALVTVVNIETSDSDTPPTATGLSAPKKFRASVTCPGPLGSTTSTITKEMKALLRQANPTQMRISVFRDGGDAGALSRNLSVVAGHGWVVFKAVPPPPTLK